MTINGHVKCHNGGSPRARGRRGGGGGRLRRSSLARRSLDGDADRGVEEEQEKMSGECQVMD